MRARAIICHMTVVSDDDEEQAYREIAAKGSVDGVIVHAPRTDDPRIGLLSSDRPALRRAWARRRDRGDL